MTLLEHVRAALVNARIIAYDVFPMTQHPIPRSDKTFGGISHYEYIENHRYMVVPQEPIDIANVNNLERFMRSLVPGQLKHHRVPFRYNAEFTEIDLGYLLFSEQLGVTTEHNGKRIEQFSEQLPAEVMMHTPAEGHLPRVYSRYVTVLPFPHADFVDEFVTNCSIAEIDRYNRMVFDGKSTQPG